jgi:hypothetical protein
VATGSGAVEANHPSEPGVLFRERLTPGWFGWFAAAAIGASLGFVVLPLAGGLGYLVGFLAGAVPGALLGIAIMAATSARVEVTSGADSGPHTAGAATELQAGRARIGVRSIGAVEVLDQAQMANLRGRGIDPRSYHCQRGWLPAGVKVDIADPADPTPYWLISSRRPAELAGALRTGRGATPQS